MIKLAGIVLVILLVLAFTVDKTMFNSASTQKNGSSKESFKTDTRREINYDNVLIRINEQRLTNDLSQLITDTELQNYALARAQEISKRSELTHETNLKISDYTQRFSIFGEVLFSNGKTTSDVIQGWMNSPTHKDIILSKDFDSIGLTVLKKDPKLGDIVVVILGKKK